MRGARAVVHLGALEPVAGTDAARFHAAQVQGYGEVLALGQRVDEGALVVVTRGMRAVAAGEAPDADHATTRGAGDGAGPGERVADGAQPRSGAATRRKRRRTRRRGSRRSARAGTERVVAWRGDTRWVEQHAPVRLEARRTFRERGVYLITGGFGPVGLTLAAHLAARCQARLVLVSRRGGEGHAGDIARLEALGAEVLAIAL